MPWDVQVFNYYTFSALTLNQSDFDFDWVFMVFDIKKDANI